MKIKTAELKDRALDYAAAMADGYLNVYTDPKLAGTWMFRPRETAIRGCELNYSTNLELSDAIITREGISVVRCNDLIFPNGNENGDYSEPYFKAFLGDLNVYGPTFRIAALRCFVASRFGDEVEIPYQSPK